MMGCRGGHACMRLYFGLICGIGLQFFNFGNKTVLGEICLCMCFYWKQFSIKNSNNLPQYTVKFNQERWRLCPDQLGTVYGKMSKGIDFNAVNSKLCSF